MPLTISSKLFQSYYSLIKTKTMFLKCTSFLAFHFNPTIVWLKLAVALADRVQREHLFQSYYSLIKTPTWVARLAKKFIFQSYYSLIKTSKGYPLNFSANSYFNPTIVWLKLEILKSQELLAIGTLFQSYYSLIKTQSKRWEERMAKKKLFQSYYSLIKTAIVPF